MHCRVSPVIVSSLAIIALTAGCARNGSMPDAGSSPSPLSPSTVSSSSPAGGASTAATRALPDRIVTMMDACDPDTFNAPPPAGIGPGTCVRSGGVQFANFLEQLGKHGAAGAWHFAPPDTSAAVGQVFVAMNRGGETHTFTEVETFGGGIVPPLNDLSHNPVMARECGALEPDDFVPPGGSYREEPLEHAGTAKFQCCIHPWMRLEVKVAAK